MAGGEDGPRWAWQRRLARGERLAWADPELTHALGPPDPFRGRVERLAGEGMGLEAAAARYGLVVVRRRPGRPRVRVLGPWFGPS